MWIGNDLANLGHCEEALAASEEAVGIRRRLAGVRPAAFLPALAMSLGVKARALAALNRHKDAANAGAEALEILCPFVAKHPDRFSGLARTLVGIFGVSADAAEPPHLAVLQRVAAMLGAEV